ncbi:NAD(P)-dependent oxidoreductase [Rhodococcus sp. RS1C4]|uniref:SDR family NAD(P)-dependent oxidoreductase n=1 Tax=Nocardiaceae TaxID=85025 RepID=UPI0003A70DAF|nr:MULTISPECIES: SDR family oxidoreductase [Rhodococcus]OZC53201.1 NAD(P)-dependent oxidoreductase [Rhodococcus sp. RS1C4]OZC79304.1 NAD(P)-dependent oxidoreductase [Rhodococcus sp. 06-418-1B]OZD15100.1 NAD(P)-dependent oxidoreductase [Rhodococcus sp. 06-156-4C]OZD19815.1 NAD(P)-dependent oxidoreductase [Rhodococcus sp. 06-156-4a]OZD22876.1 NAD(P)-dependent oxidoreductase [Rhodococcus sp. 06-156-3C]
MPQFDAPSRFDLSGRVALITGGSRGLGKAMAFGLAQAGADVIIASRDFESCQVTAKEIEDATGRRAFPIAAHVGKWDALDELVDTSYEHFGKVDVLINNAGMSPLYDSVDSISETLFDKVLGVNLKGPFRLAALIGTRMAQGDGGSIINISSAASTKPRPDVLPYAAAKAGLNAITVGLAKTFGPTVRTNAIMAGTFLTDVSNAWDMEAFSKRAETFAAKRGGDPNEIVGAALYLASDASSYTTGSIITVDGGM